MKVFLKVSALNTQGWAKKSLMIFFAQTMLRDDFLCSFQWKRTYPLAACWLDQMKVFLKVTALYSQGWVKKSLMIFFAQNVLRDDFLCSFQWKRTYPPAGDSIEQSKVFLAASGLDRKWSNFTTKGFQSIRSTFLSVLVAAVHSVNSSKSWKDNICFTEYSWRFVIRSVGLPTTEMYTLTW